MTRHSLLAAATCGAVTLLILACGEPPPSGVSVDHRPEAQLSGVIGTLLACRPMPADSTTQVLGPEGGSIAVGPHRLWVPAGALGAPVAITAVAPSDTVNRVVFAPDGLTFQRSARLTMSYANCGAASWLIPKRIAYTTDALEIIAILRSFDHPLAQRVSAGVDHFSTYAVAW
jgi:hypothetical protein